MSLTVFALVLSDQEVNAIQQTVWGRSHASFWGFTVYLKQLDIRHDGQFASLFTTTFWTMQLIASRSNSLVAHFQWGSPPSRVHKHSKPWGWVPSTRFISQWTKETIFTRKTLCCVEGQPLLGSECVICSWTTLGLEYIHTDWKKQTEPAMCARTASRIYKHSTPFLTVLSAVPYTHQRGWNA